MIYLWQKSATPTWLELNRGSLGDLAEIERPGRKRLLLEATCTNRKEAQRLRERFGGRVKQVSRASFLNFLRVENSKPIPIGQRLVVTNARIKNLPLREQLVIPAGAAFGTGEHATTAMSLRLLEESSRNLTSNWRLLDVGTGSGIFALAAARFGAKKITAIDNDPSAISTARENARQNKIVSVKFLIGDALALKVAGKFEIITANLYVELLIAALPEFKIKLADDARLILSGVLRNQEREIRRALGTNNLRVEKIRRRGKWIAILATQKAG